MRLCILPEESQCPPRGFAPPAFSGLLPASLTSIARFPRLLCSAIQPPTAATAEHPSWRRAFLKPCPFSLLSLFSLSPCSGYQCAFLAFIFRGYVASFGKHAEALSILSVPGTSAHVAMLDRRSAQQALSEALEQDVACEKGQWKRSGSSIMRPFCASTCQPHLSEGG